MTAATIGSKPMIVQGDGNILLEVENEFYAECRDWLSRFAELVKSPEYIHTYKITPLATWNAPASGLKSEKVLEILQRFSKYQLPQNIVADIQDWFFRYGKLKLEKIADKEKNSGDNHQSTNIRYSSSSSASAFYSIDRQHHPQVNLLLLTSSDDLLITEIYNNKSVNNYILRKLSSNTLLVDAMYRGRIKNALIKIGYPVEDLVGYVPGDPLPIRLREKMASTNAAFKS